MPIRAESQSFHGGRILLHAGDCLEVMKSFADASVDSVVTDPPYHLTSIVKRFGGESAAECKDYDGGTGAYKRASRGFMGKQWDGGDIAFRVELWREVLRVLKPGGHVVAFSGTRTYHRMASAIEDAGFEIRDLIAWMYGTGFPKSHNLKDDWKGWGTALKPAFESICFAQKPLETSEEIATIGSILLKLWSRLWLTFPAKLAERFSQLSPSACGADPFAFAQWNADEGFNIRADLFEQMDTSLFDSAMISSLNTVSSWSAIWAESSRPENTSTIETELSTTMTLGTLRFLASKITPKSIILAHKTGRWLTANASHADRAFSAFAARLSATRELSVLANAISQEAENCLDVGARPLLEPICFARKPISEGSIAANVLKHGTGAINVGACRVVLSDGEDPRLGGKGAWSTTRAQSGDTVSLPRGIVASSPLGRWPANVVHDGSAEVVMAFPDADGAISNGKKQGNGYGDGFGGMPQVSSYADSGSAARFFYSAKADANSRIGSKHPTVKPVDLMRWLVRLVTPPGGVVLDPFAGTGTTGEAAFREGFSALLIEREEEYRVDIARRMEHILAAARERKTTVVKSKGLVAAAGPLFGDDGPAVAGGANTAAIGANSTSDLPNDWSDRTQTMNEPAE